MADDGEELPDHEESCGEDRDEMDGDADAIYAMAEPVPFAGRGAIGIATAGLAGDVQEGETREREAEEASGEDEDWRG